MIKRVLLEDLKAHLLKKEISLIIGPRQSGKTTLLSLLQDYLIKKGKKTLYLNLDVEADRQFFVSQEKLIKKIRLEVGSQQAYIFIDEIQRKKDAGVYLKGIYDLNLPYKFIVSGSGSLELKEKLHESLSGRKVIFELTTLTFSEFVNYKTGYRYESKLHDYFTVESNKARELLEEYLNFGGYPRVVLETKLSDKYKVIDDIYRSYMDKDITLFLGVKKTDEFSNLVRILASQIGQLVNYSELSSTLGIALQTVREYLWYLEKTFIISQVTPFSRNIRKEITKNPLFYFSDLGLRNYSLGVFGNLMNPTDKSYVFQNFVYNIVRENLVFTSARTHFWRTKGKAEVDFVIDKGQEVIPLEVKYKPLKMKELSRSYQSFLTDYTPQKGYIVNLALKDILTQNKSTLYFIPFYELLFTRFR